jgi:hypothetical protein
VEVPVTCEGATRAFQDEHTALLLENIRLKAQLIECQRKLTQ